MRLRNAFALCCALITGPFTASVAADDEMTETLHNNTYQDESISPAACGSAVCTTNFAATQHIMTVVTAVNCSFVVPNGAQILYAKLSSSNTSAKFTLPVFVLGSSGGFTWLGINAPIKFFVAQGGVMQVYVYSTNAYDGGLDCTVSGYHS